MKRTLKGRSLSGVSATSAQPGKESKKRGKNWQRNRKGNITGEKRKYFKLKF
jgi:hypothetical protein